MVVAIGVKLVSSPNQHYHQHPQIVQLASAP